MIEANKKEIKITIVFETFGIMLTSHGDMEIIKVRCTT